MKFTLITCAVLSAFALDYHQAIETKKKDSGKRCLALTMSGGGTKGAYEAGALWGMYYALEDKT
jgi:hypothetical protein